MKEKTKITQKVKFDFLEKLIESLEKCENQKQLDRLAKRIEEELLVQKMRCSKVVAEHWVAQALKRSRFSWKH